MFTRVMAARADRAVFCSRSGRERRGAAGGRVFFLFPGLTYLFGYDT